MKINNFILKAVLIGCISSLLGTAFIFGAFQLLLGIAEHIAGASLPNGTLIDLFQKNFQTALFAVGGVALSCFSFGFFIAYSRLSSRAELGK